mgnify:CR=1 FL=1
MKKWNKEYYSKNKEQEKQRTKKRRNELTLPGKYNAKTENIKIKLKIISGILFKNPSTKFYNFL